MWLIVMVRRDLSACVSSVLSRSSGRRISSSRGGPRGTNYFDRTRRVVDHCIRHAAEQQPIQTLPAVRSDHNQIRTATRGRRRRLCRGRSPGRQRWSYRSRPLAIDLQPAQSACVPRGMHGSATPGDRLRRLVLPPSSGASADALAIPRHAAGALRWRRDEIGRRPRRPRRLSTGAPSSGTRIFISASSSHGALIKNSPSSFRQHAGFESSADRFTSQAGRVPTDSIADVQVGCRGS